MNNDHKSSVDILMIKKAISEYKDCQTRVKFTNVVWALFHKE